MVSHRKTGFSTCTESRAGARDGCGMASVCEECRFGSRRCPSARAVESAALSAVSVAGDAREPVQRRRPAVQRPSRACADSVAGAPCVADPGKTGRGGGGAAGGLSARTSNEIAVGTRFRTSLDGRADGACRRA